MSLRIAIDFDGTIVEHAYPGIGKEKLFAFETMKLLQKKGHRLILWTIRTGKELEEAVTYCRERGVEFYAVNRNYPEEEWTEETSRKIEADVFIDDRNIGRLPGWTEIYRMIHPEDHPGCESEQEMIRNRKWWKRLKIFGDS